ncbi:tetratricopeptide repeat protein [Persicimonas caeni]|uniref:Tetratricopeptide repeat protein n=1 Tax=Persicimonas caeni TaxID=2292766 RepID=A0A4Y6PTT9_PERCE|nr:tetratricopeptide repeat protein [Persicimonas caeni]QDG51653.1 tetratricopeptide repeat protein [Persicimonas caeni]QED32874.1 tetratricopeptide repeat protein [Persicimonas caeni]
MALDDVEAWSLSRLGFLFYSRGRLAQAAAIFHGLLQLRPRGAYQWYALGLVRRDQGDFRGAVESLNQALSCDANLWPARVALAELLRGQGYAQDAAAVLAPLVRSGDSSTPAVRRGRALWRCWQRS